VLPLARCARSHLNVRRFRIREQRNGERVACARYRHALQRANVRVDGRSRCSIDRRDRSLDRSRPGRSAGCRWRLSDERTAPRFVPPGTFNTTVALYAVPEAVRASDTTSNTAPTASGQKLKCPAGSVSCCITMRSVPDLSANCSVTIAPQGLRRNAIHDLPADPCHICVHYARVSAGFKRKSPLPSMWMEAHVLKSMFSPPTVPQPRGSGLP